VTRYIGTAGWSLNAEHRQYVGGEGTHLERYATVFDCVEIDSSFYRAHQHKTYVRWASSVPDAFRFSVKLPRAITHEAKLVDAMPLLEAFLDGVVGLGAKLGPLIVQLAPRHAFDADIVSAFFDQFRARFAGEIVCEPRHVSWFDGRADALLDAYRVARVAADPVLHAGADNAGGWPGLAYFRWHGSPEVYRSQYGAEALGGLAGKLRQCSNAWVIFDNTMLGHAFRDALALRAVLLSH
jgi:uncharacterized protein YecE (DUF72 family)